MTNINKKFQDVHGTEVCLFLRPQCNSLTKLCQTKDGRCMTSIFNAPGSSAGNCCPLSLVRPSY